MSQEELVSTPKSTSRVSVTKWVIPLIVLILIATQVWLFSRVDKLENELKQAQDNIITLQSGLASDQSNIVTLRNGLASAQSDLAYVIPLAENANFYAHSHYSDLRLKTDISDISNSLESILALHGIRFHWNTQDFPAMSFNDNNQIGFIAQEVEKVYPELVMVAPNGYKMVDYARLTPILVEAIKEQQAMIDSLQQRISSLENKGEQ